MPISASSSVAGVPGARRAGAAAAMLAMLSLSLLSSPAQAAERVLRVDPARPIAPFTLIDQDGHPFRSEKALPGQVTLVFFGFAHCPDVCPTTLLKLQNLLASDPALAKVRVMMISVDGERDTPAAMKAFLAPISPRFIGLTGTPAQVRPVARAFSAAFFRQPAATAGGDYIVDHSAQVYLVDRSGRLSELFFNAPEADMRDALRVALR